jgi:crotonobetainyl-CoA:carnitine CoA-transferase CaiB-like acyl-CoA transferase
VLDLSRVLAGPWAGQILADLGADVIKVERPGRGDDTRHWGPPEHTDATGRATGEAAYYLSANRGKRSLPVDFATPDGRDIVRRLATQSDVFLENQKVGDLTRHGLDYENLRAPSTRGSSTARSPDTDRRGRTRGGRATTSRSRRRPA